MKTTMIKRTMATIMATAMAFTGMAFSPTTAEAADFSGATRIQTNTAVQGSINKGNGYGSLPFILQLTVVVNDEV